MKYAKIDMGRQRDFEKINDMRFSNLDEFIRKLDRQNRNDTESMFKTFTEQFNR